MHKRLLALVFASVIVLLMGCAAPAAAPAADDVFTRITERTLPEGDIPAPTGEVVFTVTGRIGRSNTEGEGNIVSFDMETLESLGLIEYTVNDTQATVREATFQGVLLSELLDLVEADPEAAEAYMLALDNYAALAPITDFYEWPVMLATRIDGEYFELGQFGPTRVIYPSHAFTFDEEIYNPRWVWSLSTIEIR